MIKGSIVTEYFKNPFFWWGFAVVLLTKFNSALIINEINQAIWIKQFYLLIIFPTLIITVILATYSIRRGFIEYAKEKENKKSAIIFILTILMIFWLEAIFSFIDVIQIMTVQAPQIVTDKEKLDYNLNLKDLIVFLALPILSFIVFHNMKSQLEKKGFQYEDKLRNNLKFVLSGIGCSAVFAIIAGVIILK